MDTIDEPQIVDYYIDEPHGVRIVERLNAEFDELQNEMIKLKKRIENISFFLRCHKELRCHIFHLKI